MVLLTYEYFEKPLYCVSGIRSEVLNLKWIKEDEYVSTSNTEYFLGSHKLDFNIQKVYYHFAFRGLLIQKN